MSGWVYLPKMDWDLLWNKDDKDDDWNDWDDDWDHHDNDWDKHDDDHWEDDWDNMWDDDYWNDWDDMWDNASFLTFSAISLGAVAGMLTI